jgi:hypothetical protein
MAGILMWTSGLLWQSSTFWNSIMGNILFCAVARLHPREKRRGHGLLKQARRICGYAHGALTRRVDTRRTNEAESVP